NISAFSKAASLSTELISAIVFVLVLLRISYFKAVAIEKKYIYLFVIIEYFFVLPEAAPAHIRSHYCYFY
ncbi:MAG: hypothetical protein ACC634_06505, partial [Hyphomicrobiales bacterium]